jgi:hypothetical protein
MDHLLHFAVAYIDDTLRMLLILLKNAMASADEAISEFGPISISGTPSG